MEDSQIIELYFKRSESAIKETKAKYGKLCYHIAFNILKSKEDAEECENDTYLKAWDSIPPKEPDPLPAYLCKIVRNLALQKYEYYTAKKRNRNLELVYNELEECIPGGFDLEDHYSEGQLSQLIDTFLRGIDQESRILFVLRYWHTNPIKVIAARFHMSESKVKSSLFRTRNKLKIYLEEEGYYL
ncbi:MAG: sigma-70 family RNA polymerase sigma factor [Mobilitalea sp.]